MLIFVTAQKNLQHLQDIKASEILAELEAN